MSDSLWPHGLKHTRLPCLSPPPGACSNSCPLSQWCHPTISSSVVPFSSCLQSFPASGTFPVSQLFTSDDQSVGASASASTLPTNIQGWFPLGLIGLISLLSKGLSRVFSSTTIISYNNTKRVLHIWGKDWRSISPNTQNYCLYVVRLIYLFFFSFLNVSNFIQLKFCFLI